jgi:hypothetical protein
MLVNWQRVAPFETQANRAVIHANTQPERESSVHFLKRNIVGFVFGLINEAIAFCDNVLVRLDRCLAPVAEPFCFLISE